MYFESVIDQVDDSLADEIVAFWTRHHAFVTPVDMDKRARQAVLLARSDRSDEILGISTAVAMKLPRFGQWFYFYRTFVEPDSRQSRVAYLMLQESTVILEQHNQASDSHNCLGVMIELEHDAFGSKLRAAVWPKIDYAYAGLSQRRLEMRVHYFRGARLT